MGINHIIQSQIEINQLPIDISLDDFDLNWSYLIGISQSYKTWTKANLSTNYTITYSDGLEKRDENKEKNKVHLRLVKAPVDEIPSEDLTFDDTYI